MSSWIHLCTLKRSISLQLQYTPHPSDPWCRLALCALAVGKYRKPFFKIGLFVYLLFINYFIQIPPLLCYCQEKKINNCKYRNIPANPPSKFHCHSGVCTVWCLGATCLLRIPVWVPCCLEGGSRSPMSDLQFRKMQAQLKAPRIKRE